MQFKSQEKIFLEKKGLSVNTPFLSFPLWIMYHVFHFVLELKIIFGQHYVFQSKF